MAENKKFYWIKLKDTFMTSDAVDFLMGQDNGAEYVVLYQMLVAVARDNKQGKIDKSLVTEYMLKLFRSDDGFINTAFDLYKKIGIIEINKNDFYDVTIGNFDSRNSIKYKEWRKKIYERDNYTCQICGERGCELQAHHIELWSRNTEKRYDLLNGITLCVECHKKIHREAKNGGS